LGATTKRHYCFSVDSAIAALTKIHSCARGKPTNGVTRAGEIGRESGADSDEVRDDIDTDARRRGRQREWANKRADSLITAGRSDVSPSTSVVQEYGI
jgi:hypothetical protein